MLLMKILNDLSLVERWDMGGGSNSLILGGREGELQFYWYIKIKRR